MGSDDLARRWGREFPRGTVLFREGDPGREMYVVQRGSVVISKRAGSVEKELTTLGPGEFLGEMSIVDAAPRSATATCAEDCRLLVLDAATFEAMVKARMNILVFGGTGAGKTTFLNILSASIPDDERIITVEDAAELILQQEHTVRLETRPPNIEGKGAVTQRDLVRNALRMRPDRIIVGEVRGGEALDMLQAMNTGHDGSISTIHANTPRDALSRIETMVLMAGFELPNKAIREQISSALNVILQLSRMSDGTRKVVTVSEITGMEGDVVVMQDIFRFEKRGMDRDGKVLGEFRATGVRPKFLDAVHAAGIHLGAHVFAYRPK